MSTSLSNLSTMTPPPSASGRRGTPDETGPVGEMIGEFRLLESLGSGGMGEVYLGHDTLLDRPVAIKILRDDESLRATHEAYLNEARAAARIQHPNVAAVYRVGEVDGRKFIAGELVRGKSLDLLPKPLPWREALKLAIGLCRGLAAAHRRGVLHGDLKPANAILAEDGTVKLVDFGLAQLLDAEGSKHEVDPSAVLGTPYYMPPEAWVAQSLSRRSDVYSMGALLYELVTGHPPFFGKQPHEIAFHSMRGQIAPISAAVADVDPRFTEILQRCLERAPERRYPSAEELREALEELDAASRGAAVPEGNPYRGLLAFEAAHRALFFGRDSEIGTILERLRTDPFVLVAGDSGTGKSSLCRAGVLPRVAAGGLDGAAAGEPSESRAYRTVQLVPGRRPATALAAALAPELGKTEDEVFRMVLDRPDTLRGALSARTGRDRGLLVFVDQLEELLTISHPAEAAAVSEALGQLAQRVPGVRLLMSIRGDFLARATVLPGLGEELTPAIYLLRPLSPEKMRQAIVGPARTKGVSFESDDLVESLIASTGRTEGGLPLLQFALSELWDAKPEASTIITARSLEEIGGVEGALARHADHVLHRLPVGQQAAARRMLCSLVTLERTRARRMGPELTGDDPNAAAALDALVRGRLLVASEVLGGTAVEIAHEALVTGWFTLRRMLDEQAEARVVRDRLETAAADWKRLGKGADVLWGAAQLAETARLDIEFLSSGEKDFLEESHKALKRRRRLRAGLLLLVPVVLVFIYGAAQMKARRDLEARLQGYLREAAAALADAEAQAREADDGERRAYDAFDHMQRDEGERLWGETRVRQAAVDGRYRDASQKIEAALALDVAHTSVREQLARVLYLRILLAERRHQAALQQELLQRLDVHDTAGVFRRLLDAPAKVAVRTEPPGAEVSLARFDLPSDGRALLEAPRALGATPLEAAALAPGSYLLELRAPGRAQVRYPILLHRGESLSVSIPLARTEQVPEGFVYVPEGRFLFGAADDETLRKSFLVTVPEHQTVTGPFLIARRETTFGEWIDYLRALPSEDRKARLMRVVEGDFSGALKLSELEDGAFKLEIKPSTETYSARSGEPIVYRGRATERSQDWLKMPVLGRALDDMNDYLRWLDRTGRVRGARLCSDQEWERAARGADGRLYPHGSSLSPSDANFYDTHGKDGTNLGPDEVGAHPLSASPFGVDDMTGNAFEWVRSSLAANEWVIRGGCFFFDAISARSSNRNVVEQNYRDPRFGLRVCAPITFP
jgi:formylglycine-generating enzyme required for sulfatase activity